MDGYKVETSVVQAAADAWADEAGAVSTAAALVADATTSGFRPDALVAVEMFLRVWDEEVRSMSSAASSMSESLAGSAGAYGAADDVVVEWLGGWA